MAGVSVIDAWFVGRSTERKVLAAAAEDARRGAARMVLIEGAPGVGKSALVARFVEELAAASVVVDLRGSEFEELIAWSALAPVVPLTGGSGPTVASAGQQLLELMTGSDDELSVVVLDDLQWLDLWSRRAMAAAISRLDHEPVLVVAASRPGVVGVEDGWDRLLADTRRCRRVVLDGLSTSDVLKLAELRDLRLSTRAAERLREHTGGSPLYVGALLDELPARVWESDSGLPAPRSFAAVTAARVAALPFPAVDLIAALAVLNEPTGLPLLVAVAGVEGDPLSAVDALIASGLVTWVGPDMGVASVAISHPLIRAAVYDELSPRRRRDLHLAAAGVVDRHRALGHRVAAVAHADDELASELADEAVSELNESGPAAAARLLGWAADVCSVRARREHLRGQSARMWLRSDNFGVASLSVAEIRASAPSPVRSLVLGEMEWHAGDSISAEKWLLSAEDLDADADARAEALTRLASHYVSQLRGGDAASAAERAMAIPEAEQTIIGQAVGYRAVGVAQRDGAAAGLAVLEGVIPDRADHVPSRDLQLLVTRGVLRELGEMPPEAVADLSVVIVADDSPALAIDGRQRARVHLARALVAVGQWDEALLHARVAAEMIGSDHPWEIVLPLSAMVAVLAGRGEWSEARSHLDRLAEMSTRVGSSEPLLVVTDASVAWHRARREWEQLLEVAARRPIDVPRTTGIGPLAAAVEALIELGRFDEAEVKLNEMAIVGAERGAEVEMRVSRLQGRISAARGDAVSAVEQLQRGVDAISSRCAVLEVALLHLDLGRTLRAVRRRKEALEHLRAAAEILDRLGATPYLRHVDRELDEAGLHQARQGDARSRLDLTPREGDVATLAVAGLTNKEIAARLFVSPKAVEFHLRNVYGKLGISSRRDLSAVMGPAAG